LFVGKFFGVALGGVLRETRDLAMKLERSPLSVVLFLAIILLGVVSSPSQVSTTEYQVKAAFLYNFAQFVDWPMQAFARPDAPFVFCLAGDPFGGLLDKMIQGETLNGRSLAIRRIARREKVQGCHLIYIGLSEAQRSVEIVTAAASAPILTVGETEDFIDLGGIIRFMQSERRIRFGINPAAADRVSLRMSSRLLRLADIVRPRQRADLE
jgi:uncharacterized protein DUF4154